MAAMRGGGAGASGSGFIRNKRGLDHTSFNGMRSVASFVRSTFRSIVLSFYRRPLFSLDMSVVVRRGGRSARKAGFLPSFLPSQVSE